MTYSQQFNTDHLACCNAPGQQPGGASLAVKRGDTVEPSPNSMSIEIEPRSLAATRRVALVLALLGLATCRTTNENAAAEGGP